MHDMRPADDWLAACRRDSATDLWEEQRLPVAVEGDWESAIDRKQALARTVASAAPEAAARSGRVDLAHQAGVEAESVMTPPLSGLPAARGVRT